MKKKVLSLAMALCLLLNVSAVFSPVTASAAVGGWTNWNIQVYGNDLVLTWPAFGTSGNYTIERAGAKLGTYGNAVTVTGTTYTDTGAAQYVSAANNKYTKYYRISRTGGTSIIISLEGKIFGNNCRFYDAANQTATSAISDVSGTATTAQWSDNHYAFFFKPGNYVTASRTMVGVNTSLYGLGKLPTETILAGVRCESPLGGNNTCTFWRSIENVEVRYSTGQTGGTYGFNWCVAQAAPARRINSVALCYFNYEGGNGWSSPGFFADCNFRAGFQFNSQQNYTRNSVLSGGSYPKQNWNTVIQGSTGSGLPADSGSGFSSGNNVTNIAATEKIREKPFIYLDNGEYKVFIPGWRTNASGTSWTATDMGPGVSVDLLDKFYIAYPGVDTADSINAALADGKHLLLTPGIYQLAKPIHVTKAGAIVLGLGYAQLEPTSANPWGCMLVEDVDGVIIAGIMFEARYTTVYHIRVGEEGRSGKSHQANPIMLQDLFFRVGGKYSGGTYVEVSCQINSNDVIIDHFWCWRADHGSGVGWGTNRADYGLWVSGDRVISYGLFNEHYQKYNTYWEGNNGKVYFVQNESPYDGNGQAWSSHGGTATGYAQYKVAKNVQTHYAVGLGCYSVTSNFTNAYEMPHNPGVLLEHVLYYNISGSAQYIVNRYRPGTGTGTYYLPRYPLANNTFPGTAPPDSPTDQDLMAPSYTNKGRNLQYPFPPVVEDPYAISLSEYGPYTFPSAQQGYATQTARTVTVTNIGTEATGALTAALSGANASSFTLFGGSMATIATTGGTRSFTVVPNTGLKEGTYTATVTVSGGNGITASFNVSFTVLAPPPPYEITLSQTVAHTFPSAMEGYGIQTPLTVTVANTGANPTGALSVALSGPDAISFTRYPSSIPSIEAGDSASFTVVPITMLEIGTYTATVTVRNTDVGSKSFNVSFTVTELRPDTNSIALKKPIKASFEQAGNPATNANNGDPGNYWSAYGNPAGNFGNWLEVDLGDVYYLTREDIVWYLGAGRSYQYEVWAKSETDSNWGRPVDYGRNFAAEGYTRILDKTGNTTAGDSRDNFTSTMARYLAIKVTGGGGGATTGAIHDWSVFGWRLTSASYVINETAKIIDVPAGVTPGVFLSGVSLLGNAVMKLSSVGTVKDGDKLSVTDVNGGVFAYTLHVAASGGVKVTGSVKSYNPGNETTVRLMQGDAEKYRTTIESKPGSGPDTQSFEFTGVAPGEYTLIITKDAHTSFTVQKITVGGADLDLTKDSRDEVKLMTLLCGDISGDDMINDGDLAILWLAANYNKSAGDAGVNELCDLNGDGMINDGDLAILWLAVNYNKGAIIVP